MPISEQLLEILCCPRTRTPVRMLDEALLGRLNAEQEAGRLLYADGTAVSEALAEGLVTTDGLTVYRIDDSIPVMLVERAIPTSQLAGP